MDVHQDPRGGGLTEQRLRREEKKDAALANDAGWEFSWEEA